MVLLLVYLFIALFFSFLCSIMESVLLSTPIGYLKAKEAEGTKSATKFIAYKEVIDRPLSAILTVNTFAHTIGAAGVGAQATLVWGDKWIGLVSFILTLLILFFTEIIPKTLGATYYKELMSVSQKIIGAMIFLTYPLVIISAFLTKLISNKGEKSTTSREEIAAMAQIGLQEGIFMDNENKIIQNLIQLKHVKIRKVMTPRIVVIMADENLTVSTFLEKEEYLHFSRIPIFDEHPENVTGFVLRQDAFEKLAQDDFGHTLKEIKRPIIHFKQDESLMFAWEKMMVEGEHIALVKDEFGGMAGIITLEDILETLIGIEIVDEKDHTDDMQKFALERWKKKQKKHEILTPGKPQKDIE